MDEDLGVNRNGIVFGPSRPEKRERAAQFRREMTPEEARLWRHLRGNRLAGLHFRRQQVIDGFVVDFYCHALALIVEVDGSVHDGEERQGYDAERDRLLTLRGLRVVRVRNEAVATDLDRVLGTIYEEAERLSGRPLPPFREVGAA